MNFNKQIFTLLTLITIHSHSMFGMEPMNRATKPLRNQFEQSEFNARLIEVIKRPDYDISLIETMLTEGAQINTRSMVWPYAFKTPLMIAAQNGRDSLCELLINHGARIDTKESKHGHTALMVAVQNGCESTIKLLIDHGAPIDTLGNDGETALTLAAERGHTSIGKILLDKGAQFDSKSLGFSALQKAVFNDAETMIRTLVTSYNTFSPEQEFQISRQRIWTALCVFKRYCPLMPKDVRKLILYLLPELKHDVINSGAFGSYNNLTKQQAPFAPLPIVRLLTKQGKLNPEEAVAIIKSRHFYHIFTRLSECKKFALSRRIQAFIHPDNFKRNFATAIEWNIRRRLGLPVTWAEAATSLIPESCSMQ